MLMPQVGDEYKKSRQIELSFSSATSSSGCSVALEFAAGTVVGGVAARDGFATGGAVIGGSATGGATTVTALPLKAVAVGTGGGRAEDIGALAT